MGGKKKPKNVGKKPRRAFYISTKMPRKPYNYQTRKTREERVKCRKKNTPPVSKNFKNFATKKLKRAKERSNARNKNQEGALQEKHWAKQRMDAALKDKKTKREYSQCVNRPCSQERHAVPHREKSRGAAQVSDARCGDLRRSSHHPRSPNLGPQLSNDCPNGNIPIPDIGLRRSNTSSNMSVCHIHIVVRRKNPPGQEKCMPQPRQNETDERAAPASISQSRK